MGNSGEITAAEAAEIIGVTPTHVRWYHRQGYLPGRRIGGRLLVFRLADVEAFEKPKKTGRPVVKGPAAAPGRPVAAKKPRKRAKKKKEFDS